MESGAGKQDEQGAFRVESSDDRVIDRARAAAVSMRVGDPGEGPVCALIGLPDRLLVVLEHAVYSAQLADQVDPKRTNIDIPNVTQKILSYGATDPFIGRTILTARSMFKPFGSGKDISVDKGLSVALSFAKDVSAMLAMQAQLGEEVRDAVRAVDVPYAGGTINLPSIGDARAKCHAFAQKLGHAVDAMHELSRLFIPQLSRKWIDSLIAIASSRFGPGSPLAAFLGEARVPLLFMRNVRNMIEHPKPDRCVNVSDFRLTERGDLVPPRVEIIEPGRQLVVDLVDFMADHAEQLALYFELLLVHLCGAGSGDPIVEVDDSARTELNPHQRFYYAVLVGDQLHPLIE